MNHFLPLCFIVSLLFSGFPISESEHVTRIGAALDGIVSLRDGSGRVVGTFSTGPRIRSSCQDQDFVSVQISCFLADFEDDFVLLVASGPVVGDLFFYSRNDVVKMMLSDTVESLIKVTPYISEKGAVAVGSRKTSAFVVDSKTGRLIGTYSSLDSQSTVQTDEVNEELVKSCSANNAEPQHEELHRLFITRTDYELHSFRPNSNKVSWSMKIVEIGYAFICQDLETQLITATMNLSYELGLEIGTDFEMPLQCQSKGVVQQFRELRSYDDPLFSIHDPLPPRTSYISNEVKVVSELSHLKINFSWRMPNNDVLSMVYEHSTILPPVKTQPSSTVDTHIVGMTQPSDTVDANIVGMSDNSVFSIFLIGQSTNLSLILLCVDLSLILLCVGIVVCLIIYHQWGKRNKTVDGEYRIGKLLVSSTIIARGSNDTIVFKGSYEGREVAVKRLDRAHYDIALKETQNLIACDQHLNIVRYYGMEEDKNFVYIALEHCTCSLDDLIRINSNSKDQSSRAVIDEVKRMMQDRKLWKANGRPSHLLLQLMRDMVSGLGHLHQLGIIHWDLKPQNVLISFKETSICAKLSDMGYSRHLNGDRSSLGHPATGCSTSGWQPCEQLQRKCQTRAVDLFSLGCVLFYCITRGRHRYGDSPERDNKKKLRRLNGVPEAKDIISLLLNHTPEWRPSAVEVLHHPLFWSSEMRLSFFRDTSDRVKLEDRLSSSKLLKALESIASVALVTKWNEKLEPAFIAKIEHHGRYRFDSVRDLLRVMRNKLNHYRELPKEIQELVGPVPEGFDDYFASRFPRLLIEVYKVVCKYCKEEESFQKYFRSNVV